MRGGRGRGKEKKRPGRRGHRETAHTPHHTHLRAWAVRVCKYLYSILSHSLSLSLSLSLSHLQSLDPHRASTAVQAQACRSLVSLTCNDASLLHHTHTHTHTHTPARMRCEGV